MDPIVNSNAVCPACNHMVLNHSIVNGSCLVNSGCDCAALTAKEIRDILCTKPKETQDDPVNHPSHYTAYVGLEIIDLTEQMNFNRGNAVKYIALAGLKNPETELQDLEKARWYIDREIERIKKNPDDVPTP